MMRVLLVQPSCIVSERCADRVLPFLPVGLASIASALRASGHQLKLLDALTSGWGQRWRIEGNWIEIGLPEEEIAAEIRRFRPQVVGFSVPFTTQMPRMRSLANWVKAIHPEIFVVCGGNHPSAAPEDTLAVPEVDVVVLGEGEEIFPRLLARLERGQSYQRMDGIAYRKENGVVSNRPNPHFIENLDSLPLPAYDLIPVKAFFKISGKRGIPLFTSRGCGKPCTFCSFGRVHGTTVRRKSTGNIIKEMKHLVEFYGVREFFFDDDNLFSDREAAEQLLSGIVAENLRIQWTARNGVDPAALDEIILAKVMESGGKRLHFSPESGSRRVLNSILEKPVDLFILEHAIARSLEAGLKVSCHFTIGHPGETLEEVYETLNFAWKLRSLGVDDFDFSLAVPYAGTGLRAKAENMGCILPHPEPMYMPHEGCLSTDEITAEEMVRIRDTAEREFNSRGLVVGLKQKVAPGKKIPHAPEDRFFYTVAPQPRTHTISPTPDEDQETAEEVV